MPLKVSQRQKLERQKFECQTQDVEEMKKFQWGSPQKRADFNRKMRRKLEDGIKDLSDLVLILESLPPTVLENAKLKDDLPRVIKFVEVFLEKADPLPVAEHESGDKRTFRNYATCMEDNPDVDAFKRHNKIINGKRYVLDSINVTASASERYNFDVLQKHVEHLQRYIDPSIIIIDDKNFRKPSNSRYINDELKIKWNMMGQCGATLQLIEENIPTNPPCKPRVLIDGKICEISTAEEEPPTPSEE